MPVLTNVKYERFAQLVAGGVTNTEAVKMLGYSVSRAAATGCNIAKNRKVQERIAELSAKSETQAICSAAVDRAWVLGGLKRNAELGSRLESDGRTPAPTFNLTASNQAFINLGKELGMFRDSMDHTLKWSGNLGDLDEKQLAALIVSLERALAEEESEVKTIEATGEIVPE